MICRSLVVVSLLATSIASAPTVLYAAEMAPYPVEGNVIQRLKAFDNPEAAIFSADGKYVLVSNAAELGMPDKGFFWAENAGYISKLEVQENGTLRMIEERLVTDLTGPLGMAVSTVATETFPAGTIFLCAVGAPIAEADGTPVTDPARMDPKLVAFSIEGERLGEIPMGIDSAFAKLSGAPATLPNAAGFDQQGNLYVADTGIGGGAFDPAVNTAPGLFMVPHGALDALAKGEQVEGALKFVAMPGGPDGVEVDANGNVHTNTVGAVAGLDDQAQGGMFMLSAEDFAAGKLPEPIAEGLGALDGLDFAGDIRLDTEIMHTNSVVVTKVGSAPQRLSLNDTTLSGPADIAVLALENGEYLLVIPELSALSTTPGEDAVTVVKLSAAFSQ